MPRRPAHRRRSTRALRCLLLLRLLSSSRLLESLLRHLLEGGERSVPELVEVRAELADPRRVDLINAAVPGGPVGHEAGLLEHPQMLRDGRTADREPAGQLAHGPRTLGEKLEDLTPGRVPESVERKCLVSRH